MLTTEKLSKNLIIGVIETKLYQRYQDFIDENPEHSVTITLESKGKIKITKSKNGQEIESVTKDRSMWLYGV